MKLEKKMAPRKKNNKIKVEESSGNVFADLGLSGAKELFGKAQITHLICEIIRERRLTQVEAAEILGIPQPRVSMLLRGRLNGFSTDRLFRFLEALDQNIEISVAPVGKRTRRRVFAWSC